MKLFCAVGSFSCAKVDFEKLKKTNIEFFEFYNEGAESGCPQIRCNEKLPAPPFIIN
jgi:hypothetical protein